MSKRKQNELPKNDFAPDENEEIIGFTPNQSFLASAFHLFHLMMMKMK